MIPVYSASQVHEALPWGALARALRLAFVQGAQVPLRHAHALAADDTLLLMPAWNEDLIATKLVTVIPGAPHTVQATLLVLDRRTGEPRALMDGEAITLRRTAAASALAAQALARPDARTLLVVGTGRLARWMARAHAALWAGDAGVGHDGEEPADGGAGRGPHRVLCWGRREVAAQDMAQELLAEGLPAEPVTDLAEAVRAADVITCATTSKSPLVQGRWLRPGTHLDLVGGFRPDMREADDEAVQRARIVVDTCAGALGEAGDLVQPLQAGLIERTQVVADLAELMADATLGRRSPQDITLFKSVGTALEDLAAAQCVLAGPGS